MVLEGKRLLPVSNTCFGESMKTGRTYKEETSWVKMQKLIKAFDNSKSWLNEQMLTISDSLLSPAKFSCFRLSSAELVGRCHACLIMFGLVSHGDIGGGQATDALQVKIGGGLVEGQHCWGRTQTFEKLNHPYHSTFTNTRIQILQIQIKKIHKQIWQTFEKWDCSFWWPFQCKQCHVQTNSSEIY